MQYNRIIFFILILVLTIGHAMAQTEGDVIMQQLVEESQKEAQSVLEKDTDLLSLEVEAKDGILIFHYLYKEGKFKQPESQEDIDLIRESFITYLKSNLVFTQEEGAEEDEDISEEELFEHLKGFRFVFLEENTRKGFQIDVSSEEIRNTKLVVTSMDLQTQEKVKEHMMANRYANDIAKFNKELCPLVSGEIIIDSMLYDYENLKYYSRVSSIDKLAKDLDAIKSGIRDQMVFAGNSSAIFTTLAELNGGWYMYFLVQDIDSLITVYFSPVEIKEMLEDDSSLNSVERARYSLNAVIEKTNAQVPMMLDEITRLDSLRIEGDHLVYHFTILDQFETVKENISTLRWVLLSQFNSENVQISYMLQLCIHSGYGLCYRYIPAIPLASEKKKVKKPKKSDIINICFSVKELEGLVE